MIGLAHLCGGDDGDTTTAVIHPIDAPGPLIDQACQIGRTR